MRDDVIAAIYDAPLADKPWASLAPLLRSVVNASSVLFKFTPVGSTDDTILVADAEWEFDAPSDLYRRVYQYQDPTNYQHMSAGKFYRFEDLVARDVLQSSDYYTRFCKPLNIEHAFFCYFGCHDGIDAWLYGARDGARGAFSADEAQAIRGLLPHLDRSVQVYSRLERQRSETQIYGNTVAALGIGVVLLDRQGSIVSCNKEADAILAESSAVVRFENRLRLAGAAALRLAAREARSRSCHATPSLGRRRRVGEKSQPDYPSGRRSDRATDHNRACFRGLLKTRLSGFIIANDRFCCPELRPDAGRGTTCNPAIGWLGNG
jgi:PAS domain-containing protein